MRARSSCLRLSPSGDDSSELESTDLQRQRVEIFLLLDSLAALKEIGFEAVKEV